MCRAYILRVSLSLRIIEVKTSPKSSQMEAKDIVFITTGYPVTVLRKAVAPLRWSSTKVRGDVQKSSQACIVGRACNTRQSPLSIIGNVRILGTHVLKDVCFTPGGLPCASERRVRLKLAEDRATCSDRMGEVSRGHSSRRKRDAREPAGQA